MDPRGLSKREARQFASDESQQYPNSAEMRELSPLAYAVHNTPEWAIPEDSRVRYHDDVFGAMGYVTKSRPNLVTLSTADPWVYAHELEHTRQLTRGINTQDSPPSNVLESLISRLPAPTVKENQEKQRSNLNELRARLGLARQKQPHYIGANYDEDDYERLANVAALEVRSLASGKPLYEHPAGKYLVHGSDDPMKQYVYERTLAGVPTVYEGQTEQNGSMLDRWGRIARKALAKAGISTQRFSK